MTALHSFGVTLQRHVIRPYRHVFIIVHQSVCPSVLCYPFAKQCHGGCWGHSDRQEYTCTVNSTWGGGNKLFLRPPFSPCPSVHAKVLSPSNSFSFWQLLVWNHKMVPVRFAVLLKQHPVRSLSVPPPLSAGQDTTVSSEPLCLSDNAQIFLGWLFMRCLKPDKKKTGIKRMSSCKLNR